MQCMYGRMILASRAADVLHAMRGAQIQTAGIFLVGCPACNANFKHFFCALTCSPDQSLFTNVSAVQHAPDNNKTAVKEVDIFVADSYGERFYNSCKVRPSVVPYQVIQPRVHLVSLSKPRSARWCLQSSRWGVEHTALLVYLAPCSIDEAMRGPGPVSAAAHARSLSILRQKHRAPTRLVSRAH